MSAEVIDKAPYWARRRITLKEEDGFGGETIIFVCFGKWKRDRGNKQKKNVYTSNTDVNV